MAICLVQNSGGYGGISGRAGNLGQASIQAGQGYGANSYGYPVLTTTTGIQATFNIVLTRDLTGSLASDLTNVASAVFTARPCLTSTQNEISVPCTLVDKPNGQISITLSQAAVDGMQGLYFGEIKCLNASSVVIKLFRCYLEIRPGMTGSLNGRRPLTIMDVRLALMDTSIEANQALDDLQFSDHMIMHAIDRAVSEWNETPPQITEIFTPTTFPYRQFLLKGTIGYLLQQVAYRYIRNRMQHSAAGMSYDDNDKGPEYKALARQAKQDYRNFISTKKTQHNRRQCYGTISEPYFDSSSSYL